MLIKNTQRLLAIFCYFWLASVSVANDNDLGQTIQIHTRFHSFIGKPTWLLVIRDLDHDQVIPYLYDIRKGNNMWLAFTHSRNYRITVSELSFFPYHEKIQNFCGLQGGVYTATSMSVNLSGDLAPNKRNFNCHVMKYPDDHFTIVKP